MNSLLVFCLFTVISFSSYGQKILDFKNSYKAKVYLTERKEIEGIFYSLTDSSITIMNEKSYATSPIPIDSIYKIEIKKYNHAKRSILTGVAVGFTIGFALGQFEDDDPDISDTYKLGRSAGGGLLGGFIGALAGGVVSKLSKSYLLAGNALIFQKFKNELTTYQFSN